MFNIDVHQVASLKLKLNDEGENDEKVEQQRRMKWDAVRDEDEDEDSSAVSNTVR